MITPEQLQSFPTKRIKPVEGMAVTADVWEESHEYHRQHQRLHALFSHGPGIVTGLEVMASDPPDSAVYILPGIAVDPGGQTIVLTQPLSYDIGRTSEGRLYLLLAYNESRPRAVDGTLQEGAPLYVHAEFSIEAVAALPDTPYVELARLKRQGRAAPLTDAKDAAHPGLNEIDRRFRREIGAALETPFSLGVVHLGGFDERHRLGADYLARAVSQSHGRRVWVDDGVTLAPGLETYTLVYLVGHAAFQLTPGEMNALYACLQGGGTLFVEGCRRGTQGDPPSHASLVDMLSSLGIKLEKLPPGHSLLTEPSLFAAPPAGFETGGTPAIGVGEGAIYSTGDYGCLWQGERRSGAASREDIRSALEWGGNLIAFAEARRRKTASRKP